MRPGARIQAAIEVLEDIAENHRPASSALADWGRRHRFAGSGDRAAIGTIVFDALRNKNSFAWKMQTDSPRALALAAAMGALGFSTEQVQAAADGSEHAPDPLSGEECQGLAREMPEDLPSHIRGDFPQWMEASLERVFGKRAGIEGAGLSRRAPVDLRLNGLKATREKVLKALDKFGAEPTPLSPLGVRVRAPIGGKKAPNVEADTAHGKGWFEIQDEGSQIAALLAGASPREQVMDLCAGAGGKTLAMASGMQNTGQIYAYDSSRQQLRPIFERLKRAGARNVQVMEAGEADALGGLSGRFDLVLADAPCTGSGTWRRRPDSKWRLKPEAVGLRIEEQRAVLDLAAPLVKPGGRLCYVTCSVLAEENGDQVAWFTETHPDFKVSPIAGHWAKAIGGEAPASADGASDTLLLTPATHGTDGFFIAILEKSGS
ncbi:MAG: RsmB/NOP family class I SAM-dependent RNA methyltransferase [Alphaproteobacteria bacterium]|nr:RsmB/NOP family class I SAM-dependent RNA methyltransferase [Alphaproteobacteria bacterium]